VRGRRLRSAAGFARGFAALRRWYCARAADAL